MLSRRGLHDRAEVNGSGSKRRTISSNAGCVRLWRPTRPLPARSACPGSDSCSPSSRENHRREYEMYDFARHPRRPSLNEHVRAHASEHHDDDDRRTVGHRARPDEQQCRHDFQHACQDAEPDGVPPEPEGRSTNRTWPNRPGTNTITSISVRIQRRTSSAIRRPRFLPLIYRGATIPAPMTKEPSVPPIRQSGPPPHPRSRASEFPPPHALSQGSLRVAERRQRIGRERRGGPVSRSRPARIAGPISTKGSRNSSVSSGVRWHGICPGDDLIQTAMPSHIHHMGPTVYSGRWATTGRPHSRPRAGWAS